MGEIENAGTSRRHYSFYWSRIYRIPLFFKGMINRCIRKMILSEASIYFILKITMISPKITFDFFFL